MRVTMRRPAVSTEARGTAVAGSFYPRDTVVLGRLVDRQAASARARRRALDTGAVAVAGILVPHAGLEFSGVCAATGWTLLAEAEARSVAGAKEPLTVVMLGTVHRAWWLEGVGIWDGGPWRTPLGDVPTDTGLAPRIADLGGPFTVDREAHRDEHSLEVQLPFVRRLLPDARIVPLAVAAGTGRPAIEAGERLGVLLAEERAAGRRVVVAISTDMAHYPPAEIAAQVSKRLAPYILALDPAGLGAAEADVTDAGLSGVACGMCGIAPAVVGLATLRAMGAGSGVILMSATSADVGAPDDRTVGYLAVAFPS